MAGVKGTKAVVTGWLLTAVFASVQSAGATSGSFTNASFISIPSFGAATPYPSGIDVTNFPNQQVTNMTVTLRGFEHNYPYDVDVLLVSPSGASVVLMSDVGGVSAVASRVLTFDDAAATSLTNSPLVSGTYKVSNTGGGDSFPPPAPTPSPATSLAELAGSPANGLWQLYVVDDSVNDAGALTNGWVLNLQTGPTPPDVFISEFRVRGSNGANDEFIELYNNSDYPVAVQSSDGSAGWSVVASDGITRFILTNGLTIPARGHYLGVNSLGYSLASYPAGNGTAATGNSTYTTDIADNAGIALFSSTSETNRNTATRLDAVGSTSEANSLYREGAGYAALTPFSINHSFFRNLHAGLPQDTDDNARDLLFADINGIPAGAGQRLGAPGPENLSGPVCLASGSAQLGIKQIDPYVDISSPPNFVRDFTSDPANNSTFGTMDIRLKLTNSSDLSITRIRFRIADITTFPAPSGVGDLRIRTCNAVLVGVTGIGNVLVNGTALEQPPNQPDGGGFNSTLSVGGVNTFTPLAAGGTIYVRCLVGIQQAGYSRFHLVPETIPAVPVEPVLFVGSTELGPDFASSGGDYFYGFQLSETNGQIRCSSSLIRRYQFQTTSSPLDDLVPYWSDLGSVINGSYGIITNNFAIPPLSNCIFRLITVP